MFDFRKNKYPPRIWSKDEWSKNLLQIPKPPKNMWICGSWPAGEYKFLAVVGTRKFTEYGKEAVSQLISELEGLPIVIVSGLALGIDALAHEAALQVNLKTIAVPGSGLDPHFLYPKTNYWLAQEILQTGNCLLSPFEPKTPAAPWMFVERNSILAGLCDATLIIECEEKSGTLITGRLALEFNRNVGAVPGSIFASTSSGPNRIIKEGAVPITSKKDILQLLGIKIDEPEFFENATLAFLSEKERFLLTILNEPREIEELAQISKLDIKEINETIPLLEIRGLITRELGKVICQKRFRK